MSDAYEAAQAQRRKNPQTHHLKTWPAYFGAVIAGVKTFEVRKADRDFMLGDFLCLEEWDPETKALTGSFCVREVTYILSGGQFGIEPGFCVMGIART